LDKHAKRGFFNLIFRRLIHAWRAIAKLNRFIKQLFKTEVKFFLTQRKEAIIV
jgi:hypothetical protein